MIYLDPEPNLESNLVSLVRTMNRERRPLTQDEVVWMEAVLEEDRSYEKRLLSQKRPNVNPILGGPTQTAAVDQKGRDMKDCTQDYNQGLDQVCQSLHR